MCTERTVGGGRSDFHLSSLLKAPGDIFWFMVWFPNPQSTRLDSVWPPPRAIHWSTPTGNRSGSFLRNRGRISQNWGMGADTTGSPEVDQSPCKLKRTPKLWVSTERAWVRKTEHVCKDAGGRPRASWCLVSVPFVPSSSPHVSLPLLYV